MITVESDNQIVEDEHFNTTAFRSPGLYRSMVSVWSRWSNGHSSLIGYTLSQSHAHTHTHTHSCMHTHTSMHAHTYTHTHILSVKCTHDTSRAQHTHNSDQDIALLPMAIGVQVLHKQYDHLKINCTCYICLKTMAAFCTVLESYIMRKIAFEKRGCTTGYDKKGRWGFTIFPIEVNEYTCNCY